MQVMHLLHYRFLQHQHFVKHWRDKGEAMIMAAGSLTKERKKMQDFFLLVQLPSLFSKWVLTASTADEPALTQSNDRIQFSEDESDLP